MGPVITERNYLLLSEAPWDQVRPLLDRAWFPEVDDAVRFDGFTRQREQSVEIGGFFGSFRLIP